MKNFLTQLLFLALTSIPALSSANKPNVICEILYTTQHLNGSTDIYQVSEPFYATTSGTQKSLGNFLSTVQLKPIQAAGSGPMPIVGYDLLISIQQDITFSQTTVNPTLGERYGLQLNIGLQTAFAYCDVLSN